MLVSYFLINFIFLFSLQNLELDQEACQPTLVEADSKLFDTLPLTSPEGQTAMKEQLQQIQREWDQLKEDLNAGQDKLESRLQEWEEFDDTGKQLDQWLDQMEEALTNAAELRDDLPMKKVHWQECKVRLGTVMTKLFRNLYAVSFIEPLNYLCLC